MDQQKNSLNVKALWLQYHGLKVEFAGKLYRIENAARGPASDVQHDCLSEPGDLLVAT